MACLRFSMLHMLGDLEISGAGRGGAGEANFLKILKRNANQLHSEALHNCFGDPVFRSSTS